MTDLFDVLKSVLGIVVDAYPVGQLPSRRYVTGTRPAWDCPQVTVLGMRLFEHQGNVLAEEPSFANLDQTQEGVEVEVSIVRDAPMPADDGNPPTTTAMEAAARRVYEDAVTVPNAIREAVAAGLVPACSSCAFAGWRNDDESGGLMGGTTTVLLNLAGY